MFSKRTYFALFIMLLAFSFNLAAQDCSECEGVYLDCQADVNQCLHDCTIIHSPSSCNFITFLHGWQCFPESVRTRVCSEIIDCGDDWYNEPYVPNYLYCYYLPYIFYDYNSCMNYLQSCNDYCHYITTDSCNALFQNCMNSCSGGQGGGPTPDPAVSPANVNDLNLGLVADLDGCIEKPVNLSSGNMYLQHADYVAEGLSSYLSLVRTYNNQNYSDSIFGIGWSHSFSDSLEIIDSFYVSIRHYDGRKVYYHRNSVNDTNYVAYSPPNDKSNIIINSNGTYTLLLKTGETSIFNSNGRLTDRYDRNGNVTTFAYDGSNRLIMVTSPTGRTLNFNYNGSGKVSAIYDGVNISVDPGYNPSILGTIATYEYDSNGYLSKTNYSDGSKYQYYYTYNSGTQQYFMTSVKDALNNTLESHSYDNYGRATSAQVSGNVEKNTITYYETETHVVDSLGKTTIVTFDKSHGRSVVTSVNGPYCQQAQSTRYKYYDDTLNMIQETDQLGYNTHYQYDFDGNVTNITTSSKVMNFLYNHYGQVVHESNSLGSIDSEYDSYGNLIKRTYSTGAITEFDYDTRGLLTGIKDPRNHTTQFNYDQFGYLTSIINELNQTTASFGYDIRGRITRSTDALNNSTYFEYDFKNRLISVTYPDNSTEEYIYNVADKLVKTIDANDNETIYNYDIYGRLQSITDALGRNSSISYDLMSNIVAKTDAINRTTEFSYNDMDLLTTIKYPEASPGMGQLEEHFTYDAAGNILEKVNTANFSTFYFYDADRRPISFQDPAGHISSAGYDIYDNIYKFVDTEGNLYKFEYDLHNRLKTITHVNRARIRYYNYDLAGNRTSIQDFDGSITYYDYDSVNRLWRIRYPDTTNATFTYNNASQLLTASNENGTLTFSYDNRGRVSSVTDVWGKQIFYQYDGNGNRTLMTLDSRTTDYEYDALNRLTGMYENTGNSAEFTYDTAGRLNTRTLNNLLITTHTYNGLDLLTNINYAVGSNTLANFDYEYSSDLNISKITDRDGIHLYYYDEKSQLIDAIHSSFPDESFTYDRIGNHINQDGTTPPPQDVYYQYDLNGDLKKKIDSAKTPTQKNITYKYDALGRLIERIDGTQWTRYTYDGDNIVLDVKNDGTHIYYGNGPGIDNKLWYVQGSSTPVFFMTDHQGSTRGLISSTGSIISGTLINYDSFGKPSISLPTRFQYTGREYDPDTKLYYYRARWYDPEARRFISEDPIGLNGGINLYGYVRNNPLNGTDPSGKIPVIFYVWAQGVIASPDTRFDIEMLSRSLGNREYGNAILDLAAIAIPGVSSLHLRAAKEGGKRIVCKIGGNAASKVLNGSQIAPYRELQAVTRGQRGAIQAHHILEQRHLRAWGYSADEILQAPSQVLSRAEHTALNRSLQRELPTGTEYTRSQVWSAYERVYQNYPGYLDAISSYFK